MEASCAVGAVLAPGLVARLSPAVSDDNAELPGGHGPGDSGSGLVATYRTGPYYPDLVPKDIDANIEFRKDITARAVTDLSYRAGIYDMCKNDLLFWVNTFVWVFEPRTAQVLPFITYECQDRVFFEVAESIGHHDLCIVKSRDMGGTWIVLTAFAHRWQFFGMSEFQLVSRVEDDVDTSEDMTTLMPKIDFIMDKQPGWLAPPRNRRQRQNLILRHKDNRSLFRGYATTGDVGRSGRRLGCLFDEFAAVRPGDGERALAATQYIGPRIWISTPQGPSGAFAKLAQSPTVRRIDLDWTEHPQKNPGLYTSKGNKLKVLEEDEAGFSIVDFRVPDYQARDGTVLPWPEGQRGYPPEYKFIFGEDGNGLIRSPYFDYECRRTPIPRQIAQELNRDFLGSGAQFFDAVVLERLRPACRPAEFIGEFVYDPETGDLLTDKKGKVIEPRDARGNGCLHLWANLDEPYRDRRSAPARDIAAGPVPPEADYILGVDVSAGTGTSNSVIAILDRQTGEQVGQFASPHVPAHKLAPLARALGLWLNEAYIIWDGAGVGATFGNTLIDLGYTNFYRKTSDDLIKKVSNKPGWFGKGETKTALLYAMELGLAQKGLTTYCEEVLSEAAEYLWTEGSVEHSSVPGNKDPTNARKSHGDRVMALAIAWDVMPVGKEVAQEKPKIALPGSLAYRRERRERREHDEQHKRHRRVRAG